MIVVVVAVVTFLNVNFIIIDIDLKSIVFSNVIGVLDHLGQFLRELARFLSF